MFGGISTSICTWSGHISASTILTPFLLHSMLKIFAMSWRNAPYATFLRNFGANTIWYLQFHLGQFTRNYTQTTKRGLLTTKQAEYQAPGKCGIFSLFCCPGFPKGLSLWHTTLLAKCSVLYALSALLRKCGCRRGGQGHFYGRKAGLWLRGVEPQAQDWFRQQTGRIWKPPSLIPRRTSGQNVPNLWTHSQKSKQIFLSKLEWAGKPF